MTPADPERVRARLEEHYAIDGGGLFAYGCGALSVLGVLAMVALAWWLGSR